jgi:hypothetical protein
MSKLISWYIEYCKKVILFPFEFLTSKKFKTSTKIIVCGVFLVFLIIILPKKNKNDKFRLINETDIEFIKEPGKYSDWSDINSSMKNQKVSLSSAENHLNSKVGERVGYVITLGEIQAEYQTGKRIINIHSSSSASISIPFTYERNCPTGSTRPGDFSIEIDCDVDPDFQNKKCLVKGNIKDISVKVPNHACDDASATVYLENCSIEVYKNNKK